jgi:hypothetical protein
MSSGTPARVIDRASNRTRWDVALELVSEYERLIRAAIHDNLWTSVMDCGVDRDDLYSDVVLLIHSYAHELTAPGTAKVSTRLYALVKRHCFFVNQKTHRRVMLTRKSWQEIAVEYLTPEQIATESAAERESYLPV